MSYDDEFRLNKSETDAEMYLRLRKSVATMRSEAVRTLARQKMTKSADPRAAGPSKSKPSRSSSSNAGVNNERATSSDPRRRSERISKKAI